MDLTNRQRKLLLACIEAELDNNIQCDTPLSVREMMQADDPGAALETLREELRNLARTIRGD